MSLKYDRVKYLSSQLDIADAIEDLKNGKRHAKRNLYRFVYGRRMSKQDYKEIVKRYNKLNVTNKFVYYLNEYADIFFFISIIAAIGIILSAIKNHNFMVTASVIYLLLAFFVDHYSHASDIENKDHEIAQLKQEIRKLEKELETAKNTTLESCAKSYEKQ